MYRAAAFALIGTTALATPILGRFTAIPFVAVALLALFVISDGPVFDLFARPGDYRDRTLYGLAGFSLSATVLALLATIPEPGLPVEMFVAAVCLLVYGNLAEQLVRAADYGRFVSTAGFVAGAFVAGIVTPLIAIRIGAGEAIAIEEVAFLAASGALLAALLRSVLYERDDPVVMLTVALFLWLFAHLGIETSLATVSVALGITAALGYASYALETASIPGMLTGVLLSLLTIILGGYEWFLVLIAFFVIGGLSSKFQYERKANRGVAEENEGARGSGNVLGNSTVALVAVIGYAATPALLPVSQDLFLFAFAGSIATALSDTLSSEIGSVYDDPRLITTLERVEPGTDGGVTVQGELAGVVGAVVIAAITALLFDGVGTGGAAVIIVAGVAGMTVDSLIGATLEGEVLGNQGVNFTATLAGATVGVGLAVAVGVAALV